MRDECEVCYFGDMSYSPRDPAKYREPVLVGLTEAAERLGISRRQILALADRMADFPDPVAELSIGDVYLLDHVEDWYYNSDPDHLEQVAKIRRDVDWEAAAEAVRRKVTDDWQSVLRIRRLLRSTERKLGFEVMGELNREGEFEQDIRDGMVYLRKTQS